MKKYKNKYRVASARAPWWDYGSDAAYFITICTHRRECYFGDVRDGVMQLSAIGDIAQSCWMEIPDHFPFVHLGEFVVMPNHVHGIVVIDKMGYDGGDVPTDGDAETDGDAATGGDAEMNRDAETDGGVETQNFAPLPLLPSLPSLPSRMGDGSKNKFGPQSKNLGSIIRGFKIGVTKNARLINPDFAWQSRYHDHIIRDNESHARISNYIIQNPSKWNEDRFY